LKSPVNPEYEIVGFRRSGGFYHDQWDVQNNGTLMVHSKKDGEVVELLKEDEANFYTFFMKPLNDALWKPCSPLRFQVTIGSKEEMAQIESIVERSEGRLVESGSHNISRALKDLGVYFEIDDAISKREKVLSRQIESSNDTPEEKQEKLERLRDMVGQVRSKYL
jgi:hypothetical protein